MFDTTGFWKDIIIFVLALIVVYYLLRIFVLRFFKNKDKAKNIFLNTFLVIGIIYFFYRIYQLIDFNFQGMIPAGGFMMTNIINQTLQVSVLALATTGIVLIFKTSTTTNFAQGMIATFGAYVSASILLRAGGDLTPTGNAFKDFFLNIYGKINEMELLGKLLLVMGVGAITAFIIGIFVDAVIIRTSKDKTPVGKQMITMGLVLVLLGVMPLIFNKITYPIPKMSYEPNIQFTLFGSQLSITVHAFYGLIITVILLVLLFSALRFTKWGLGVRATASNELVASMMGVNTKVITAMSWAIAGLLGAVAAVILTPNVTNVSVIMMTPTQVNAFMAAILGSFSSFLGPLVASVLIPVLTGLLSLIVPLWQNAVVYIFILVVVLVKPMGLFGKKIAKKV
jgi:branched-chain amino acid transport system permease protein